MHSSQDEGPEMDHTATIPAGRIVHDERGNALWKWRGDTDSDEEPSGVLKYVDPADLTVEGGKRGGGTADGGGGYDPYNQAKPRKK